MIQIRGTTATLLAWTLVTLGAAGAGAPRAAGRFLVSPDATAAWVLAADGKLYRSEAEEGPAEPWAQDAGLPPVADIDLAPAAGVVLALAPAENGKLTDIVSLDASTGAPVGRWRIRGRGRLLQASRDATLACVLGTKPRAPEPPRPGDWMLTVVDLADAPRETETGEQVVLGFEPSAAWLVEAGPEIGEARILLATEGRIASYTLDPPRSSWFYLSPGDNRAMAMADDGSILFLLRGADLAVINPEARPENRGRGQLAEDDATTTMSLPGPGGALGLASDGRAVAILDAGAGTISLVDTFTGEPIEGVEPVPGADLIPRRFPHGPGEPLRLPVAISGAGGASVSIASRTIVIPELPEIAPGPEASAETPVVGPAPDDSRAPSEPIPEPAGRAEEPVETEPAPTPAAGKVAEPEPVPRRPVLVPVPPGPPPAEPSTPETESGRTEPSPQPPRPEEQPIQAEPTPPPPAPEPKPAEARAPDLEGPSLEGRVTGAEELQLEVLAYGPDNLLKLHGRAKVSADGTWRMPLPPPGGYRLVVTGGQKHVFTSPQFMRVVVPPDPVTLAGLDFEIRGNL